MVRGAALSVAIALAVAGCGGSSGGNQPHSTHVAAVPTTVVTAATPGTPPTSVSGNPSTAVPVATPSAPYRKFVATLCRALRSADTSVVSGDLSNYQYNTGVRWGYMGDGEGQTSDPSIFSAWLAARTVRCAYSTPDSAGHGALLTRGWHVTGGPWSIIELDTYSGQWKITDFTFGRPGVLYRALRTAGPAVRM